MPLPALSLAVVGADYPNQRGPTRRFEIQLCVPGESIELRPEPTNRADPQAVAVFTKRGIQIGYLTAERAPWIGSMIRSGREMEAIFQEPLKCGAAIRVAFDGESPTLPRARPSSDNFMEEQDFWPDPTWDEN
ncbi:HIRAN domain-containing protein [Pacificimonas sp. ICDLI1SI03]